MLQARHGFAVDNLVSARVVLANGTAVTASSTSHPDLFWAMKGAGHNFGIVTSLQVNVYEIRQNWTAYAFIYSSKQLEAVLDVVDKVDGNATRPANLVVYGVITRIPNFDPENVSNTVFLPVQEREVDILCTNVNVKRGSVGSDRIQNLIYGA